MGRAVLIAIAWMLIVWALAFVFTRFPSADGASPNPLHRWDASFYQGHATGEAVERKDAFFPLYGIIIGFAMKLAGGSFEVVSSVFNSLLVIAMAVIFAAVGQSILKLDRRTTPWLVAGLLSLPASFSLLAPYPTALVVLLALLAWYFSFKKWFGLAMIASCLAFFIHPSGLAIVLATTVSTLRHRWNAQSAMAVLVLVTAAIILISSGLLDRFLEARTGFSIFPGVHFWQQGVWYLKTHSSLLAGISVLLGTMLITVLTLLGLRSFWRQDLWLNLSTAGLFILTVWSGLWTGLARYMLASPLIPIIVTKFRPEVRMAMIAVSFLIQIAWLQSFVSWKAYV